MEEVSRVRLKQEIFNEVNENIKALKGLFPSVVKDGQVDFQALKEELGEFEEVGPEKYGLTWSGKKNAKKIAQQDIIGKTLKYIPEESKNPETTENLYIEGDNLEVLKLLRQNYYKSIKMIYIDPPYNTGNSFIYNDNFKMDKTESDKAEGDVSDLGERYIANPKSSNRYHARWLNNMYPRLKVAKDLLTDDGVIFISIDDNEVDNLKKICVGIFGEDNFIACIARVSKTTSFRGNFFAPSKDYLLCFAKNLEMLDNFSDSINEEQYNKIEKDGINKGEKYRDDIAFYLSTLETRPNQRYFIECPDGQMVIPPGKTIPPEKPQDGDGVWRWSFDSFNLKKDLIVFKKTNKSPLIDKDGNKANWNIYTKSYLKDKQQKGNLPRDFLEGFLNRNGSEDLKGIDIPFVFPKPVKLIKYLLKIIGTSEDDIILDFFSGSSTTAHAVMKINSEDGGRRKFIMVQLPEKTDEKSEANKLGYKNICEIGKERIRRAGEKIKEENKDKEGIDDLDIGFKVFRVSDTNIRWNYKSDNLKSLSRGAECNVSINNTTFDYISETEEITLEEGNMSPKDALDFMPGFKDIDVVYEVLLRQRDIPLSTKVELLEDIGKRTYMFADSYLVCLEENITAELIEKLAALNPLPIKFILRDSAFGDDIALKDEAYRRLNILIERNIGVSKKAYTVEFI